MRGYLRQILLADHELSEDLIKHAEFEVWNLGSPFVDLYKLLLRLMCQYGLDRHLYGQAALICS
jgi:hypothetical protein